MFQKKYGVTYCGSDKPWENDDAYCGSEHDTWEGAMFAYLFPKFSTYAQEHTVAHIFLHMDDWDNGPGNYIDLADRPNPGYDAKRCEREQSRDDAMWRSEFAMQQGMGLGFDAYNDAMGW